MKKIMLLTAAIVAAGVCCALAQEVGAEAAGLLGGEESVGFFAKIVSGVKEFLVALATLLLVVVAPLFAMGHMVVVLVKTRGMKRTYTAEQMAQRRVGRGLSELATAAEDAQCEALMDEAYLCYSVVEQGEQGEELRSPKGMRDVLRMNKKLAEAGRALPTGARTLERYNKYRSAQYDLMQRSFFGSSKLLWLGGIVAAVMLGIMLFTGYNGGLLFGGIVFAISTGVYYMASCVPQLMIEKKAARGGGGGWFTSILVAVGIGALGSGYTVRTKWSDGSTSDDNSAHFIALFIGLMILFFVACTMFIWAAISYLRNYVFYI